MMRPSAPGSVGRRGGGRRGVRAGRRRREHRNVALFVGRRGGGRARDVDAARRAPGWVRRSGAGERTRDAPDVDAPMLDPARWAMTCARASGSAREPRRARAREPKPRERGGDESLARDDWLARKICGGDDAATVVYRFARGAAAARVTLTARARTSPPPPAARSRTGLGRSVGGQAAHPREPRARHTRWFRTKEEVKRNTRRDDGLAGDGRRHAGAALRRGVWVLRVRPPPSRAARARSRAPASARRAGRPRARPSRPRRPLPPPRDPSPFSSHKI